MSENFLLQKKVDRSLLKRGFAIPTKMQLIISLHLSGGALTHGESRAIKILLNGEIFRAKLISVDFDRKKYPAHSDIWQVVYSENGDLAKSIREIFSHSAANLLKNVQPAEQEYFVLYATDMQDVFLFEPIFNQEIALPTRNEQSLENLLELPNLTDEDAALIEKNRLTKVRKLNRSIGNFLKTLYEFRCQICGRSIGEIYGATVVECHHIDYFVNSLDNDATNLLIVCPNHHRVIHSANPTFDREKKIYRYPNGYEEGLRLNLHL